MVSLAIAIVPKVNTLLPLGFVLRFVKRIPASHLAKTSQHEDVNRLNVGFSIAYSPWLGGNPPILFMIAHTTQDNALHLGHIFKGAAVGTVAVRQKRKS